MKECNEQGDIIDRRSDGAMSPFATSPVMSAEDVSADVFNYIKDFKFGVDSRGAALCLMPPCRHDKSFDNQADYIRRISITLEKHGMPFAVEPSRYRMERRLFWDTPYHLNRLGRRLRTEMLIEDIVRQLTLNEEEGE